MRALKECVSDNLCLQPKDGTRMASKGFATSKSRNCLFSDEVIEDFDSTDWYEPRVMNFNYFSKEVKTWKSAQFKVDPLDSIKCLKEDTCIKYIFCCSAGFC